MASFELGGTGTEQLWGNPDTRSLPVPPNFGGAGFLFQPVARAVPAPHLPNIEDGRPSKQWSGARQMRPGLCSLSSVLRGAGGFLRRTGD